MTASQAFALSQWLPDMATPPNPGDVVTVVAAAPSAPAQTEFKAAGAGGGSIPAATTPGKFLISTATAATWSDADAGRF